MCFCVGATGFEHATIAASSNVSLSVFTAPPAFVSAVLFLGISTGFMLDTEAKLVP
jgi:hypothetical protein